MDNCKNTNNSVSEKTLEAVLNAFEYSQSLTRSEIARLCGRSEMTVSRAVRKLNIGGILDLREEIDEGGHKRHAVYPRDTASILVLDLSGRNMIAVLFDTALNTVAKIEYIYNGIFDHGDNLIKFLSLVNKSGVLSKWKERKIAPTLPYSVHRKEVMRRSRAKRIAGLVAKMKLCAPPILQLGIIMPNGHTLRAIGANGISNDRIHQIVCDMLGFEDTVCFCARDAVIQGAPSVTASLLRSAPRLADARSLLFFGIGSLCDTDSYALLLCRSGARAAWRLPDGASDTTCFCRIESSCANEYIRVLSDFVNPDILIADQRISGSGEKTADTALTAALGAAIALRRSVWEAHLTE